MLPPRMRLAARILYAVCALMIVTFLVYCILDGPYLRIPQLNLAFRRLQSLRQPITAEFLIPEDRNETARLHRYLDSHPTLLRAAICLLVQTRRVHALHSLLKQLHTNFNQRFGYPILVFHEKDFLPQRDELRRNHASPLFFQMIEFRLPDFYEKRFGSPEIVQYCPWSGSVGYRHMCRFHSKSFYEQPALNGLEYFWRLDDDSGITSPLMIDPFRQLKDSGTEYGYRETVLDSPLCIHNLWNVTRRFIAELRVSPTFFYQMPEGLIFFNNFEVSGLRFWWSPEYRSFIDVIDSHGGVFKYRWGDAPIKTLALSLFVSPKKILKFKDVDYHHGDPRIPPRFSLAILEQLSVSAKSKITVK